jgi:hypothetical protein
MPKKLTTVYNPTKKGKKGKMKTKHLPRKQRFLEPNPLFPLPPPPEVVLGHPFTNRSP